MQWTPDLSVSADGPQVKYKEVMKQYNLGPNGGILTSLNLFATRFDQVQASGSAPGGPARPAHHAWLQPVAMTTCACHVLVTRSPPCLFMQHQLVRRERYPSTLSSTLPERQYSDRRDFHVHISRHTGTRLMS